MSQAGILSGGAGGGMVSALLGDNPPSTNATPAAGIIDIFGSNATDTDTVVNNDGGLTVLSGTGGTGTANLVEVILTNRVVATVSTSDANVTQIYAFSLAASEAVYSIEAQFVAVNTTDGTGASFTANYGAYSDGAAATELGIEVGDLFKPVAMSDADIDISVSGNNIIFEVIGLAAKDIDWKLFMTYITTL